MPNDTSVRSVWNMICPSCQQDDTLDVQTHVMVRITKDGTDVQESCDGSHEWDDNSKLLCASCGWTGTVNDAQIAHQQNPVHERNRKTFPLDHVEAALCAWEHIIERRDAEPYAKHYDSLGTPAMRSCAIQAGGIAEAVYADMLSLGYELSEPYDFEMVPAVLQQLDWDALVEDNQFNGQPYKPDIDALGTAVEHLFHKPDPRIRWMAQARHECKKQWQYEGLLADHPEATEAAFNEGETPAGFVKALGEKYDLLPAMI